MNEAEVLDRFTVEFNSGIPAYKQIINQVCSLVNGNVLKEGDQLPTIRRLTEALGLNPNTVAKAFRELEITGVISSQRGRGSYVAAGAEPAVLDAKERRARMDALYARMLAEANGMGISESEIRNYLNKKLGA